MSSTEYYYEQAIDIIKSINYLTLATVTPEGTPWNSPVFGVHDSNLNFYWFSDKTSQHSINVRANKKVFVAIYDSTVPEGSGEALYIAADVEELTNPEEILTARHLKKGNGYQETPDSFLGDSTRRVYKATPTSIWINDAEMKDDEFIRDYRIELSIQKLKELFR